MPVHPFLDAPLPLAIAHRGGSVNGTENTIASFGRAVELGYRYLETDVRVTADGELVVFHDGTVERVAGVEGRVQDLTWRELSELRIGGREPVPRLVEVLKTFPDARLLIDPKCDAAVDPLIGCLRDHDALDRVCVGSFSDRRLARMRAAFGSAICTSMGPRELLALRLAAWRWAPGSAVPTAPACVQMPVRYGPIVFAEPRCIAYAQARGLQVHVWTVNDRPTMQRLLDLGVDGLITDEITTLRALLEARGAWHG
ncbi:MAG: glycerophosphodiester phosphodiesterase [Actinobacteria bacterium]|nr:glycerophosphodiester phosphodiesterase [Actinomycetota bacterium]